jgi:xanthine dehydrogenase accessory factor
MTRTRPEKGILILGANDIGSATAHRLFMAGYSVALHEQPLPASTRRLMSFTDAVFDGLATLDGVAAMRVEDDDALRGALVAHLVIPLSVGERPALLESLHPMVLVDARMRKHHRPEVQLGHAELTIGLGPGFLVGETVDIAVETAWGEALGDIIREGGTRALSGEPREIGGHGRDRYVYAPVAGEFRSTHRIGDGVQVGQEIAWIGTTPLLAPITGVLRGLTHTKVPVLERTKIIEIDPRMDHAEVSGILERPARIAEGVLRAIQSWEGPYAQ